MKYSSSFFRKNSDGSLTVTFPGEVEISVPQAPSVVPKQGLVFIKDDNPNYVLGSLSSYRLPLSSGMLLSNTAPDGSAASTAVNMQTKDGSSNSYVGIFAKNDPTTFAGATVLDAEGNSAFVRAQVDINGKPRNIVMNTGAVTIPVTGGAGTLTTIRHELIGHIPNIICSIDGYDGSIFYSFTGGCIHKDTNYFDLSFVTPGAVNGTLYVSWVATAVL